MGYWGGVQRLFYVRVSRSKDFKGGLQIPEETQENGRISARHSLLVVSCGDGGYTAEGV